MKSGIRPQPQEKSQKLISVGVSLFRTLEYATFEKLIGKNKPTLKDNELWEHIGSFYFKKKNLIDLSFKFLGIGKLQN